MFNFLKKKKKEEHVQEEVKVSIQTYDANTYDPWDSSKGNSDTVFSNVIFLNMHSKPASFPAKPDEYPRYVSYKLGIHDPVKKFNELLSSGLLELADKADVLNTYKMAELKELLQKNGLPTNGKKADLIERMMSSPNIEIDLPEKYVVSANGKVYIENNTDMLTLFNNPYNISYEEYAEAKDASAACLYNDIIWAVFNRREMEYQIHDNRGRRNNACNRAKFLKAENRLVDALYHSIVVLYYDVNIFIIEEEQHEKFMASIGEKDEEKWEFSISSHLLEEILELKEYYTDEILSRCYKHLITPQPKMSQDNFKRMLYDMFEGKEINIEKYR